MRVFCIFTRTLRIKGKKNKMRNDFWLPVVVVVVFLVLSTNATFVYVYTCVCVCAKHKNIELEDDAQKTSSKEHLST